MISKLLKLLKKVYFIYLKGKVEYARSLGVEVGNECRIYVTDFGSDPFLIKIGDNVTLTDGVRLITHNGSACLFKDAQGRRYEYQRIEIGSNVFIGLNSILMPGVKVGNNVIIGAGAVVTKSIPSGSIVGGNPARIIGEYDTYMLKALSTFATQKEIDIAGSYKERVLNVLDSAFKPEMKQI